MRIKTGAGIIPYAVQDDQVCFLFHRTFSGRRAGLLVDFGGSCSRNETHFEAAAREFVEETEAMFLAEDPKEADLTRDTDVQIEIVLNLMRNTQDRHPDWFCRRISDRDKPRDWKTFFMKVAFKNLDRMNALWERNPDQRFKKRRELVWITSDRLVELFHNDPQALWTRVRQLTGAIKVIRAIERYHRTIADISDQTGQGI
ncbi:MAG: hypothetical protein QNJ78_16540 [Gammaproteobacteria bacterium]|nr:hypothetical protein [Gammaproteobacteria bacterium]